MPDQASIVWIGNRLPGTKPVFGLGIIRGQRESQQGSVGEEAIRIEGWLGHYTVYLPIK